MNSERLQLIENFFAEEEGELTVEKHEIVFLLEPDQDGWTFVRNNSNESGLIPSAYAIPYIEPEENLSIDTTQTKRKSKGLRRVTEIISPRKTESSQNLNENVPISPPSHPSGNAPIIAPEPLMKSPREKKPNLVQLAATVLRIYTNEDIHREIDEKELNNDKILRTFKSIKATCQTPVKTIIDEVAKKLLLPDTRQFHLFLIDRKALTMKLLREDEKPVEIYNISPDTVVFALIYAPKVKIKDIKHKTNEGHWQTAPGELTHRRLINDQNFIKFADFTLNFGTNELAGFKSIIEIRFPELLNIDESLIKKKREKNMPHGVAVWIRFIDGLFTLEIFQQIFDYMYTGELEFIHLDLEKVITIYCAAIKLKYESLIQYCRSHIESSIGLHNIFLVLKFSDDNKLEELKDFAINFCLNNWQTISASKEGLSIIGLSLFQEVTVVKAKLQDTPELLKPTPTPTNTIIQDFQKIRSLMHFADAVSVFGNLIIPFHRCILAAASSKFQTMFLKESASSKKKLAQYNFDNISGGAFKGLIDLIYSGTTNITTIEACELLEHIAVPFELHSVREDCEALICQEDNINENNVMQVLRITYLKISAGRTHLTINAREYCLSYICSHFRNIDITKLRKINDTLAWDVLEMLHIRFAKNNIEGLN